MIGGDHDLYFSMLKALHRMVALRLRQVGMHGDDGKIFRLKEPG